MSCSSTIVGYSKLSVNDQHTAVEELNQMFARPSIFTEPESRVA
jgi:hypothetical protein